MLCAGKESGRPGFNPIPPDKFYRNHLQPPKNPYAESDARVKAAVEKAVAEARTSWRRELTTMHDMMLRKRLAASLQLPTLSKSPEKYWLKVQLEGITASSAR